MSDAIQAEIGPGPSMLMPTRLPANVAPAFASGPDIGKVDSGKIVAYAIRIRGDFKVGDRDFSGELCLHELVIMRRFYEEVNGGSIAANATWPPAFQRLVPLTQDQLKVELNRMLSNYLVPKNNSVFVVPTAFLGTEPAEQLKRLHEVMRKQLEAWAKVVESAKERLGSNIPSNPHWALVAAFDAITARELEMVANIADPSADGDGGLELPEALAPVGEISLGNGPAQAPMTPDEAMAAAIASESTEKDKTLALVDNLVGKGGLTHHEALAVSQLVELMEGSEIPDNDLSEAIGSKSKAKLESVRRVLKG
jgi:hypothetical protein